MNKGTVTETSLFEQGIGEVLATLIKDYEAGGGSMEEKYVREMLQIEADRATQNAAKEARQICKEYREDEHFIVERGWATSLPALRRCAERLKKHLVDASPASDIENLVFLLRTAEGASDHDLRNLAAGLLFAAGENRRARVEDCFLKAGMSAETARKLTDVFIQE